MLIKTQLVREASRIYLHDEIDSTIRHPPTRIIAMLYGLKADGKVWQVYWAALKLQNSIAGKENICL